MSLEYSRIFIQCNTAPTAKSLQSRATVTTFYPQKNTVMHLSALNYVPKSEFSVIVQGLK